jgi:5-methyltetrahydropteroyltriglutamate--homocysteine methyltransferase
MCDDRPVERSTERILTTHVGSLPRSPELLGMLQAGRRAADDEEFQAQVATDMDEVIRQQARAGIDVANDGELPRVGFSFYVKDRMLKGFGGHAHRGVSTDFTEFPQYAALKAAQAGGTILEDHFEFPECQAEIRYDPDLRVARAELETFSSAIARTGAAFKETFVTAATPGIVATTLLRAEDNPVYASDSDYLYALADELKQEYEFIVSRGHLLQLDAPDLAFERQVRFRDLTLDGFLGQVSLHIDALNRAITDIPPDRIRLHVCWGNWEGPHIDDVELAPLLSRLYEARVGALSLSCANPRHQHEYKRFREHPLPEHMILLPGVIDVTTNYLEHPELVADRICQFAEIVGDPTRIIASTDCGFSSFAGYVMVAPDVAWKKLEILASGARLATERLFGGAAAERTA